MYLIIDSNALCYQAKFSLSLDYEGIETGIIFGFLRQIIKFAKDFKTTNFVFVWDSKTSLRKKYFPGYKAKRHADLTEDEKKFDEICYRQFDIIKNILPEIGFLSFQEEGFEGDDLIASIILTNPMFKPFMIISADNDLYQLLEGRVFMFWKGKKYSIDDFENEYDISVKDWAYAKAIAGCSTDEIPGVPSIGIKTACKYIRKELKPSSQAYGKIIANKRIVNFNLPLIDLPFSGTPVLTLPEKLPALSFKKFINVLTKFGFKSMLEGEYLTKCKTLLQLQ